MFNHARIRSDFNDAAEYYDAHATLQQNVLRKLAGQLENLPKDADILDTGCGTGALTRILKQLNIIALDNAYRMCTQAAQTAALPVNADMAMLPFADARFDAVFSSLALQWTTDWKSTLHEWMRVLKPSGKIVFSTFGTGTLHELAESFSTVDNYPHVSEFVNVDDIKHAFRAHIKIETVTEYYPDVVTLARHLKALGARNKQQLQRPALMTPRQFRLVEQHYSKTYSTKRGLPVSWNILYVTMQKP